MHIGHDFCVSHDFRVSHDLRVSGPSSKSVATVLLLLFYECHAIKQRFRRRLMFLSLKFERSIFYEVFNCDPSAGA